MSKSADAQIKELEAKVKLLEKQKKFLESHLEKSNHKSIIFDMMIELAEKEYNIDIQKNSSSELLTSSQKHKRKA